MLITLNGISIDYRDKGTGVPVIFIHSFPLNQTMWDDQLAMLQNLCRNLEKPHEFNEVLSEFVESLNQVA